MVASVMSPRSMPSARISSIVSRRPERCLRRQFDQRVPRRGLRQRIAARRVELDHSLDAVAQHHLERGDVAARALHRDAEQIDRGLRGCHGRERRLHRARARYQFQHRGGDDAERAFRADEQVAQIVAGIVLFQFVEDVEHAAVGEYHLQPDCMRAGDTVRHRGDAAGIGREIAADSAGAFATAGAADRAGRLRRRLRARAAA